MSIVQKRRWDSKSPKQQENARYSFNQVQGNAFGVTGAMSTSILLSKTA